MQIIIADSSLDEPRFFHVSKLKLCVYGVVGALLLLILSVLLAQWTLIQGIKHDVPVLSKVSGRVVQAVQESPNAQGEQTQINAMAQRVGQLQARLTQLDALNQRLSIAVGVTVPNGTEPKDGAGNSKNPAPAMDGSQGSAAKSALPLPGRGGVLVAPQDMSLRDLAGVLAQTEGLGDQHEDWLLAIEAKLFEQRLKALLLPTQVPVLGVEVGSRFGRRIDPFTGASAMHTGLDFAAPTGTAVLAAATGMVVEQVDHPGYGNFLVIDHGNGLLSRYAHLSRFDVKKGEVVKRGQKIAEVGSTGRSTGPHLHFEVLSEGAFQDPLRFLTAGQTSQAQTAQKR